MLCMPSMNRDRSVSNLVAPKTRAVQPEMSSSGAQTNQILAIRALGSAWRFVPVFPGSGCQNKLCPRPEAGNTTSATLVSFAEIIGRLWSSTRNWRPGSSPHWPSGYSALEHATTTTRPMMPAEPSPGGYPARFGAKGRADTY